MRVTWLHRFVSMALLGPFLLAATTIPVGAQAVQPAAATSGGLQGEETRAAGVLDGQRLAEITFPPLTFDVASTREDSPSQETLATGMLEGETLAGSKRARGKLGLGLVMGFFTGLIGPGLGYFLIGPDPMTAEALQRQSNKSPEYQMGFKSGWEKKTQSKKRKAFLAGGLVGMAAFFAVFLSAYDR